MSGTSLSWFSFCPDDDGFLGVLGSYMAQQEAARAGVGRFGPGTSPSSAGRVSRNDIPCVSKEPGDQLFPLLLMLPQFHQSNLVICLKDAL